MTRAAPPSDEVTDRLGDLLRDLRPSGAAADQGPPDGGRHRPTTVRFLSLPASLRGIDLAVRLRAVRGLLVVAVVVVGVLGGRWAWALLDASPAADGQVVATTGGVVGTPAGVAGSPAGPVPGPAQAGGSVPAARPTPADGSDVTVAPGTTGSAHPGGGAAPSPAPALLLVHVAGQVGDPGVVELPAGSRVVDAVAAAGGLTPDADPTALNLARPVVDGEQVWVGRPGEPPPTHAPAGMPPPGPGATGTPGTGQAGVVGGPGAPLLDLNTATQADLEELPGVGPVTAGQILAWRDAHGRFSRVDELLEVSGIGERTLERLEPLVTVGG
jgi:competence protein ComEA